jgi:hypothetical protein
MNMEFSAKDEPEPGLTTEPEVNYHSVCCD